MLHRIPFSTGVDAQNTFKMCVYIYVCVSSVYVRTCMYIKTLCSKIHVLRVVNMPPEIRAVTLATHSRIKN